MNRKILIIGGTSGLGRKLAELYCKENCMVGMLGRRQALLQEFKDLYPNQSKTCQADISSADSAQRIQDFIAEMGGFDIFICTASVIHFNEELDLHTELDTLATNINGFTKTINAAYQFCKTNNKGQIVIVTSIAAARGNKTTPAYNASKAFQSSYTQGLRLKLKSENINATVTEIIPGYMDTGMAKGNRLFWMASLDKAARQTKKAIEKKKRRAFVTRRWWLIYQAYRLMPSFIYDRLINSNISFKRK